ncbi:uncharacterized protein LY79DRAFT_188889 [Colletotrichum navitas]|uniref:Uncharacterized protein n=1 Tax=Colletotrichum navitas TaxID=681940 RepID=A0AAD8V3P1_9PEZI|nr:uncharacterized protein LY79DRAFT_188889 [Colletotrichum navitas]KAK1593147.1 hypothetical protein LY79DRAFT_188889 [Colletotrichum navitas]
MRERRLGHSSYHLANTRHTCTISQDFEATTFSMQGQEKRAHAVAYSGQCLAIRADLYWQLLLAFGCREADRASPSWSLGQLPARPWMASFLAVWPRHRSEPAAPLVSRNISVSLFVATAPQRIQFYLHNAVALTIPTISTTTHERGTQHTRYQGAVDLVNWSALVGSANPRKWTCESVGRRSTTSLCHSWQPFGERVTRGIVS